MEMIIMKKTESKKTQKICGLETQVIPFLTIWILAISGLVGIMTFAPDEEISVSATGTKTATWNLEQVGYTAGPWTSIAVDSSGYPHISYFDDWEINNNLKYTKWTGSSWDIDTVQSWDYVRYWTSIALDSNEYPRISYYDLTNSNLMYAKWTGWEWETFTVASSGQVGQYTSLALDSNDYPHISYYDQTNGVLKYARLTSSGWSIETVDSHPSVDVGKYTSIALDSNGLPHISYTLDDSTFYDLKYAKLVPSAPSPPQNLVASAGDSYVDLSWDVPTDDGGLPITGYNIYRGMTSGGESYIDNVSAPTITYHDPAVIIGETYYYYVTAVNIIGESDPSNEISITILSLGDAVDNPALSWSTGGDANWFGQTVTSYYDGDAAESGAVGDFDYTYIQTTVNSPGILTFYWKVSSELDYDELKFYIDGTEEDSISGDVGWTAKSYELSSGTHTLKWLYEKDGVGSEGSDCGWLDKVEFTSATVPSPPQNLGATGGDGYVDLSWSVPADDGGTAITEYNIYRGTSSGGETYIDFVDAPTTSYHDSTVTNGQTYYYYVTAVNNVGSSDPSVEVSATPRGPPEPPQNLIATAGDGYVDLNWDVPTNDGGSAITNYNIYRGTTSGGETLLTTIGDVLTYTDNSVTNDQTYYYQVSAVNSVGESALSNEAIATPTDITPPVIISGPTASPTDTTCIITWTTDELSDSVVHYGTTTSYGSIQSDAMDVTSHSITLAGLNPSTTYHYIVGSTDPSDNGPTWSSDHTFTTTATPDVTPPVITLGPLASPTDTSAIITWSTDEVSR
jgi:fibronectin type 3 domain-containing protein